MYVCVCVCVLVAQYEDRHKRRKERGLGAKRSSERLGPYARVTCRCAYVGMITVHMRVVCPDTWRGVASECGRLFPMGRLVSEVIGQVSHPVGSTVCRAVDSE